MKRITFLTAVAGVLALLAPSMASAQEDWHVQLVPRAHEQNAANLVTPVGAAIQLGGGVSDFTSDNIQSQTQAGGLWSVRGVFGTDSVVGGELTYLGSAQDISAVGLDRDTVLIRNGLEATVRANLPIVKDEWAITPFAFLGIGWNRYDLVNDNFNTSAVRGDDNTGTVPFGGGVSVGYRNVIFDARFTMRPSFDDELLRGGGGMDNWGLAGMVGYRF